MTQEAQRADKGQTAGGRAEPRFSVPSELAYLSAIVLLALAVAILTSADFGISMIVAPAYLISQKLGVLSFGQAEYLVQAGLFAVLCLVLRKFRFVYLMSFVTCLIYGAVLDLWRMLPCFDPSVTPVGSMDIWLRAVMFTAGVLLTSFSIALFYKTYLYPQVYDFFVKAVAARYGIRLARLKTVFDFSCLAVSVILTFCFFGTFVGLNWGTLVMTAVNGTLIGMFTALIERNCVFRPLFPKFAERFALD